MSNTFAGGIIVIVASVALLIGYNFEQAIGRNLLDAITIIAFGMIAMGQYGIKAKEQ